MIGAWRLGEWWEDSMMSWNTSKFLRSGPFLPDIVALNDEMDCRVVIFCQASKGRAMNSSMNFNSVANEDGTRKKNWKGRGMTWIVLKILAKMECCWVRRMIKVSSWDKQELKKWEKSSNPKILKRESGWIISEGKSQRIREGVVICWIISQHLDWKAELMEARFEELGMLLGRYTRKKWAR